MNTIHQICLSALLGLFSCTLFAQTNVVDEVVWVVGDEAILRSDVERIRVEYGNRMGGNPYCMIPEQLAIQKLFLHQAAIDSVEVTDADINQYVEQDINQKLITAGSKEKLEEYMKMSLTQIREETFEQYRNELTTRRMREHLTKEVKVTPAEVRRYFKDLPEDSLPLIPVNVEVQIVVLEPAIPQEEIDRIKGELRSYIERVNSGTSFATLARLYSEDPASARQGGEMPYYGRAELDPGFANVAFALTDEKKVSKIAQSEFGYHIVQLIDKRGDKIKCRHILKRPQVPESEVEASIARLDSIRDDILQGKFTFEDAAGGISEDKNTRNNHGILAYTNEEDEQTTRFEMSQLSEVSPELARVVDTLQVGQISRAFAMTNKRGKRVCAIAKLRNRTPLHRASMSEDFQVLRRVVEEKRKEDVITKWIEEKQKKTYVRINEDWRGCEFQYPGWIR